MAQKMTERSFFVFMFMRIASKTYNFIRNYAFGYNQLFHLTACAK